MSCFYRMFASRMGTLGVHVFNRRIYCLKNMSQYDLPPPSTTDTHARRQACTRTQLGVDSRAFTFLYLIYPEQSKPSSGKVNKEVFFYLFLGGEGGSVEVKSTVIGKRDFLPF